jgi:hypothetical protein
LGRPALSKFIAGPHGVISIKGEVKRAFDYDRESCEMANWLTMFAELQDLKQAFDNLRKFKMKLNPEKCTFGVPSRKLLRYMVSRHGIDPNPGKVSAITKMKLLESLHDVQKLMGCMVALGRFIS